MSNNDEKNCIFPSLSPCAYRSGSILFASNITLSSSLSEYQTINVIDELVKSVNGTKDYKLKFDLSAHQIKKANEISEIDFLFKNLSRTVDRDVSRQAESILIFLYLWYVKSY